MHKLAAAFQELMASYIALIGLAAGGLLGIGLARGLIYLFPVLQAYAAIVAIMIATPLAALGMYGVNYIVTGNKGVLRRKR